MVCVAPRSGVFLAFPPHACAPPSGDGRSAIQAAATALRRAVGACVVW